MFSYLFVYVFILCFCLMYVFFRSSHFSANLINASKVADRDNSVLRDDLDHTHARSADQLTVYVRDAVTR